MAVKRPHFIEDYTEYQHELVQQLARYALELEKLANALCKEVIAVTRFEYDCEGLPVAKRPDLSQCKSIGSKAKALLALTDGT